MSAFVVATVSIKDDQRFGEYANAAGPTIAAKGGSVLKRGKFNGTLAGASDHSSIAVIEFPNGEAITDWYNSDAYQAIIPLRDEACDMTLVTYNAPPA